MSTPKWKVYRDGEYIAACKYPEDAAALVGVATSGIVKYEHKLVVWTEGAEEIAAGDSYDGAAEIMRGRVEAMEEDARARRQERDAAYVAKLMKSKQGGSGAPIAKADRPEPQTPTSEVETMNLDHLKRVTLIRALSDVQHFCPPRPTRQDRAELLACVKRALASERYGADMRAALERAVAV